MSLENFGPLVSVAWLAEHLGKRRIKVLDASWYLPDQGRDADAEYAAGHIPGALRFDPNVISDQGAPYPHMLPSADQFAATVTALGIGDDDTIVAYDGMGFFSAPRAWWMFRAFGHDRVAVLDGGLPCWRAGGHPLEAELPHLAPADPPFVARLCPALVRTLDDMRANLETGAELVLDARGPGRFEGREAEPRPGVRAGHIPNSRDVHYAALARGPGGTMLDEAALRALFADAGADGARPVVCTCGSGITACVLALGLYRIGATQAAVYDGSWAEWGSRGDTPIAQGPAQGPTEP